MSEFKNEIEQALNLFADHGKENCYQKLQQTIEKIKEIPADQHSGELLYEWGLCFYIMEEYQQALLYFEKSLRYDPSHESALLHIVSTLFYDLDKPKIAKQILDTKVIPQIKDLSPFKELIEDFDIYLKHETKEKDLLSSKEIRNLLPEDLSDLNLN